MKSGLKPLTRAALLLALAIAVQSLRLGQAVTGPVINAILLIAAVLLGPWGGAAIGLVTPASAYLLGQLNPVLAPAVPFIALGNAALALIFGYGRRLNVYLSLLAAALVKYLLLAGAVSFILSLPAPVSVALRLPQLATALAGGVVALLVLEALASAKVIGRDEWPGLSLRAPGGGERGR
ncbi:MAG: ECF transporter S component [Actinomycetia bacterium]|nr:ECF transporter S component [Actinomycetes bacterium]